MTAASGDCRVFESYPKYGKQGESMVFDLSPDGIDSIPLLGRAHYTHAGGGTTPHVHPGMVEILLCQRGANLEFEHCGETIPFSSGDVFISQPGAPHFLKRYPKSLSTIWIWFLLPERGKTVLGLSPGETAWLVDRLCAMPVRLHAGRDVDSAFRRLWGLHETAPRGSVKRRVVLREAALRLLVELIEAAEDRPAASPGARCSPLSAILSEMRRNCTRDYAIGDLARRAGMSVSNLTEAFKKITGLPPHQFLVLCRMERAKKELAGTRRSIAAIANALGIASAQHFSVQFRRETGLTPLEWRKAHADAAK